MQPITLRDATDSDYLELAELLAGCFAEYTHCVLDVDGEIPELRSIATHFARWQGQFWVAEQGGRVVASAGFTRASAPAGIELKKLYVHRHVRRAGVGTRLLLLVEQAARDRGLGFIELWSDTRFETAHRFYARHGYVRGPCTRELGDLSRSTEYAFRKDLLSPAREGETAS